MFPAHKKILSACFLLLLALTLFAADKALIWEATRKGDPGKLYLVGSVHLGKADWFPLDSVYDRVLNESQNMYFEVFNPDHRQLAVYISSKGMYPPDKNLSDEIGKTNFSELVRFFGANRSNVPPFMLEKMRPWLVSIEVAGIYIRKEKNLKSYYGLEKVFSAHKGKRQAGSLESLESQIDAMSAIPDDRMTASILKSIRSEEKAKKELSATLAAIDSGDIGSLDARCREIASEDPMIYQKLFAERNSAIAKKLLSLLKEKKVSFILVGAGHFAGPDNIRDLLLKAGCRVVQLDKTGRKGKITAGRNTSNPQVLK